MSAAAQPQNPARTFRHLMEAIETLSPRQLEELVSRALSARSRKEAHADIEHYSGSGCPHCGHGRMQKWGTTPTGIQRLRCAACGRTSSALTGSPLRGLHHFDRFLDMLRDMLSDQPLSCRKLAAKLQVSKDTIWRWRLRALKHLSGGSDQTFAGIIEGGRDLSAGKPQGLARMGAACGRSHHPSAAAPAPVAPLQERALQDAAWAFPLAAADHHCRRSQRKKAFPAHSRLQARDHRPGAGAAGSCRCRALHGRGAGLR